MTRPDAPDDLNARIGVLARREVEARLLAPVLAAFAQEIGAERARAILARAIEGIARAQGAALAEQLGGNDLADFVRSFSEWTKGGALEVELSENSEGAFCFNVTRCRYAEMYEALGMREFGTMLSCARDLALLEGFSQDLILERTQTIMEGAPYCDFAYRRKAAKT